MQLFEILERAAATRPEELAVVDASDPGAHFTYARTHARARALAAWLREAGVRAGDRVALLELNSIEYFESYFAVAALGAIAVPLNVRLARPELEAIADDCAPAAWIVDARLAERAPRAAGARPRIVTGAGSAASGGASYAEVVAGEARDFEPAAGGAETVAHLYYTSGTTGRSKGVPLTHGNVYRHAERAAAELFLAQTDVWGHIAPMFHLADAWAVFALTLRGGRHVFFPTFDPPEVLSGMQAEGVTTTNVVPTTLQRLLEAAERHSFEPCSLRLVLTGGSPVAPEVARRTVERWSCEYAQTYGMTESCPFLTLALPPGYAGGITGPGELAYRTTTGRPFAGIELEVVDQQGERVPADARSVGEIRVRGDTITPGYWQRPEETAAAIRAGWLYTGDLAFVDAEGYVTIVDRKKDMILTGGENVYTTEVENVLYEHPDVLEAAVFGVPDPHWGEAVCAAVVPREATELTAAQLGEFCRSRLAGYKCPREIRLVHALPKTGSGKIRKAELRAAHERERDGTEPAGG